MGSATQPKHTRCSTHIQAEVLYRRAQIWYFYGIVGLPFSNAALVHHLLQLRFHIGQGEIRHGTFRAIARRLQFGALFLFTNAITT